jgi:hypothetical protein
MRVKQFVVSFLGDLDLNRVFISKNDNEIESKLMLTPFFLYRER